ncbi:MAG TPA: polyphenol oxidase family protein [Thermoleophilia bacterium]|nr:polyphenol oxidase family protein [Thermoleophilia bacterium]
MAASSLEWCERDGLRWLQWEGAGVAAAFPTREGGVSPAPFDSLNLGLSTHDAAGNVLENRRRLCAAVGLPQEHLVVPGQVHGTTMAWVDAAVAGRGAISADNVIAEHDALLTASPGLGLAISYADCVPVVIAAVGPDGPYLATVHAGWRGMIDGIVGSAAATLACRGRLAAAVVGPSIGPCCFAVDAALRERFAARFPGAAGAETVDLWACARAELLAAGVPAGGIAETRVCTSSDARFFSHRRDRGATGRHLALAWRQEA